MRCSRFFIILFSLFLILLGLFAGSFEEVPEEEVSAPISFQIGTGENAEYIRCWENDENTIYVFLPGYADFSDLQIRKETDSRVLIDGAEVAPGDSCENYTADTAYGLTVQSADDVSRKNLVFIRSGQIPAMYIEVASGSMDYIHMHKGNKEQGSVRLYDGEGILRHSGAVEEIKGRGNSTWDVDKKPYSLTLAQDADLLGTGKARRWVLLAEGFCTSVNIRNKIVYDYSKAVGMKYSPDGEWVDLYLNGDYAGLYFLSERNEIHPERVDIDPETGFLVSMEWDIRLEEQKMMHIVTDAGQALRIHHSSVSTRELDEIWQCAENAIMAEDGIDPVSGKCWQELIDLDSWAAKYLLEEVFGNHDGGSFSQFYYYDASQNRIFAGPIWDYDLAMGGYDIWLKDYPRCLIMNREHKEEGLYTPWFHALYEKDEFRRRVEELYRTVFQPAMEQLLKSGYYETVSGMWPAFQKDAVRWGFSQDEVMAELDAIYGYLAERNEFLQDYWINRSEYRIVRVDPGRNDVYGYLAVKTGDTLPELFSYESSLNLGWHTVDTDEPFDVTQPIYEDVQIYMKTASFQIPKIHYMPVAAVILLLLGLAVLDVIRSKNRGDRYGSTGNV